jgi:UDP-3-O-[3-hydroxymyristoyl] N-acetylglucosamine deacetylase
MFDQALRHLDRQHTIAAPVTFVGAGRHSGQPVRLQVLPSTADSGITFSRTDLVAGECSFDASWERAQSGTCGMTLHNDFGHRIGSVEHLLSALGGLGVDNARVIVDGDELPLMDGSALPFVSSLVSIGIVALEASRDLLIVCHPVRIQQGRDWAMLLPCCMPRLSLELEGYYPDTPGQCLSLCLSPESYTREIAAARAFGFAESLSRQGHLAGARSIKGHRPSQGGGTGMAETRYPDEFVRHKVLDLVGMLTLLGHPVVGHYRTNCPRSDTMHELVQLAVGQTGCVERISGLGMDHHASPEGKAVMGLGAMDDVGGNQFFCH